MSLEPIKISTLPKSGVNINETISLDQLNERMAEAEGNDILFRSPPEVEVTIVNKGSGSELKGQVSTTYRQPCSRCLEELDQQLIIQLDFTLKPESDENILEDQDKEDVGIIYYADDKVDLEDLIQETLILSLSPYMCPAQNEKGDCSICGLNIEEKYGNKKSKDTKNLGDILKAALSKN